MNSRPSTRNVYIKIEDEITAIQISPEFAIIFCERMKKWSASETRLLIELVAVKNMPWVDIANNFPGRTIESCRSRYYIIQRAPKNVYSITNVTNNWTVEDINRLVDMRIHGNSWDDISRKLGKSTSECVNQLKSTICRPKKRLENDILDQLINME